MPDTNNPASAGTGDTSPMSVQQAGDALADILGEPETENDETPANDAAPSDKSKPDSPRKDQAERDTVDWDAEDDDSTDETSDGESKDRPRDEAGRFLPSEAKVRMPDGTTITVAELTQGHLRQSDYTRKTQEIAAQREGYETERKRVNETFDKLQAQFNLVNGWLQQTRPQRPQVAYAENPIAWGEYQVAEQQWQEANQYWSAEFTKLDKARKEAQHAEFTKYAKAQHEALFKAIPAFREPSKREAFVAEAAKSFADYGITADEIKSIIDHRQILVLRDAVKYRRLMAKKESVAKDLNTKPQLIRGSKRTAPQTKDQAAKRQRFERLKQDGSFANGVAALADLDL